MSSITREDVMKMTWQQVAAALKDPKTQGTVTGLMKGDRELNVHISKLLAERANAQSTQEAEVDRQTTLLNPPSTEELAAQAAAVAATPVEPPVLSPAPPTPSVETPKAPTKITRVYQVRDENGNPIGRPTSLTANSMEEMLDLMQKAHEEATRAFHREKKRVLTFKQKEQTAVTPESIKAAAAKALEAKNADEALEVVRGVIANEYKSQEEAARLREIELKNKEAYAEGQRIGNQFVRNHLHDFNPVEANLLALGEALKKHDLEFTLENLEFVFDDLKSQEGKLVAGGNPQAAKRQAEPAPITPAPATEVAAVPTTELPATEPAAPVTVTEVAPPAAQSQPTVEATESTPAAPQSATPARRPGVNGGIAPGTLSAKRPEAINPELARKEFMKELKAMPASEMKQRLNHDPQFVKKLQQHGIRVK